MRVWRDPSLVQASEPLVRHIHSVQHISLMPHHPPPPPTSAPQSTDASGRIGAPQTGGRNPSPVTHYPPPLPPPLLSPHPGMPHSHLLAAPLYAQELWKHQRYLASAQASAHPDDILDRERSMAQDRERQERMYRSVDFFFHFYCGEISDTLWIQFFLAQSLIINQRTGFVIFNY